MKYTKMLILVQDDLCKLKCISVREFDNNLPSCLSNAIPLHALKGKRNEIILAYELYVNLVMDVPMW